MKNLLSRIIQILLITLFLFFYLFDEGYSQFPLKSYNVEAHIWTEKEQYYTMEPILVNIHIENKSDEGPRIPNSNSLGEYFIVIDSKATQFRPNMHSSFNYIPKMNSGQIIELRFNLW